MTQKTLSRPFSIHADKTEESLVAEVKDADGNITEKIPGKYESIKILEITNDEYTIEKPLDKD